MAGMNTPDFATPSADLNQALQVAFNFGAGQALANPADLLGPVRRLMEAAGQPWQDPPAGQDLRTWSCDYTALDDALNAADMMGTGQANMDVGLWLVDNIEAILADIAVPDAPIVETD